MKTTPHHLFVLLLGLAYVVFGQSQIAHAQRTASSTVHSFLDEVGIMVDGAFITGFDVTEAQLAMNPSLFENHTAIHAPVLMPDGTTPVRYNDVANMSGTLTIWDVGEQGTQVTMNVDGLIPGGLYTAWADLYQAPGFTPDFAYELAVSALGYDSNNPPTNPVDYAGNVIRADADGHGELDVIQPAGAASWYTVVDGFEIPPYLLDAPVAEFHAILGYHIDGMSWGSRGGAPEGLDAFDETWVAIGGSFVANLPQPLTLVNGNAETGDLTGWTGSSSVAAVTTAEQWEWNVSPFEGDLFFSLASEPATNGSLEQAGTMEIGKGPVLRLTGAYQTEFGDAGEAVVTLLDADSVQVAQQTTGTLLTPRYEWGTFSVDVAVPPTAASWKIELLGTRNNGMYTNTYYDDIQFGILGDFNSDGVLDIDDLETLIAEVQAGSNDLLQFDVDHNGLVELVDSQYWITDIKQTSGGDANLDGEVSFPDFLALSENFGGAGGWSEGDFDFNGVVQFQDFLLLSENFGKTSSEVSAVPEPTGLVSACLGLLVLATFRRRQRSARAEELAVQQRSHSS